MTSPYAGSPQSTRKTTATPGLAQGRATTVDSTSGQAQYQKFPAQLRSHESNAAKALELLDAAELAMRRAYAGDGTSVAGACQVCAQLTHADALARLDDALATLQTSLRDSGAGALDATAKTDMGAMLTRRSAEDAELARRGMQLRDAARTASEALRPQRSI